MITEVIEMGEEEVDAEVAAAEVQIAIIVANQVTMQEIALSHRNLEEEEGEAVHPAVESAINVRKLDTMHVIVLTDQGLDLRSTEESLRNQTRNHLLNLDLGNNGYSILFWDSFFFLIH